MTTVSDVYRPAPTDQQRSPVTGAQADTTHGHRPDRSGPSLAKPDLQTAGLAKLVIGWLVVILAAVVVVLYALAPIFQVRDQHKMLGVFTNDVRESSKAADTFYGYVAPTQPPTNGASVAILDIRALHLREVVVEGVGPSQTNRGPGHVPGTAGLGESGNSAVVARRGAFGGPFSGLSTLHKGDTIVATTTEGQSVYVVRQVTKSQLVTAAAAGAAPAFGAASTGLVAPLKTSATTPIDQLYAPSTDNRLTLVTSGSSAPWNDQSATVVVATMKGLPFVATPQQARSSNQDGRSAASGAWALLVLALLVSSGVIVGAVVIYRRMSLRSAYLMTTAPLVVVVILLSVAVSNLLPAWT